MAFKINNRVSLKQERWNNNKVFSQDCECKIFEILFNFGPQTDEQIKSFFQISIADKSIDFKINQILNRLVYTLPTKLIEKSNGKYYLTISRLNIAKGIYDSESFQKSLEFLRFLLQLRDENRMFVYYGENSINYALKCPDNDKFKELTINIMNMNVDILYCPSYDIDGYNDLVQSSAPYRDKHILLSDEFLELDDVSDSDSLLYIATIDDKHNIEFLR